MTQPKISVSVEPTVMSRSASCAARLGEAGQPDRGLLNLVLRIRNLGDAAMAITSVGVKVVGSATGEQTMTQTLVLAAAGKSTDKVFEANSYTLPQSHVFALPTASVSLRLRIHSPSATEPLQIVLPLVRASSPGGAYRFWADVRDLRPGEFWSVDGLHHAHGNAAQVHGYDVGVVGGDALHDLLPGGQLSRNEDYRIWGKPIYAIADGTVVHRRDGFPTNKVANAYPDATEQARIDDIGDGNGNFFMIDTAGGPETVLYAHMIPGSLNTGLVEGSVVRAGTYLGRAGNSGSSTGPHLHIHSHHTDPAANSWTGMPRPMTWVQARAVVMERVADQPTAAPWVPLAGRACRCRDAPSGRPTRPWWTCANRRCATSPSPATDRCGWCARPTARCAMPASPCPTRGWWVSTWTRIPAAWPRRSPCMARGPTWWAATTRSGKAPRRAGHRLPAARASSAWPSMPPTRTLWCVTSSGAIKNFLPASRSWHTHPGAGAALDICASKGKAWVIGTDAQIYQSTASGWSLLPGGGKGKRIGINTGTGKLWVIGMNDGISDYRGSTGWKEHAHAGQARELLRARRQALRHRHGRRAVVQRGQRRLVPHERGRAGARPRPGPDCARPDVCGLPRGTEPWSMGGRARRSASPAALQQGGGPGARAPSPVCPAPPRHGAQSCAPSGAAGARSPHWPGPGPVRAQGGGVRQPGIEQRPLADAGLTADHDTVAAPRLHLRQCVLQRGPGGFALEEQVGSQRVWRQPLDHRADHRADAPFRVLPGGPAAAAGSRRVRPAPPVLLQPHQQRRQVQPFAQHGRELARAQLAAPARRETSRSRPSRAGAGRSRRR